MKKVGLGLFLLVLFGVFYPAVATAEIEEVRAEIPSFMAQDILEQFGVAVVGKIASACLLDDVSSLEDRQLQHDELLATYNVLASLPLELTANIHKITFVDIGSVGSGGRYEGGGDIAIFGAPDLAGSQSTDRVGFPKAIYHEIGHVVDFTHMAVKDREDFYSLFRQSQSNGDFAYSYGKNYPWEDFATVFESYCLDSSLLTKLGEGSPLLAAKVKIVRKYLGGYAREIKPWGNIRKWDEAGEETIWRYESLSNPGHNDSSKKVFWPRQDFS